MLEIDSLLQQYADGADALESLVAGLTTEQLDAVPVAEKWSIRQVVCHLADFEVVSADRIKRILAEENPTLLDGDPDLFASALAYGQRDVAEETQLIQYIRKSTARILNGCDLEDFQRTGVHSAEGPMTLETIVERTVRHIPHHLDFIREKLNAMSTDGN